MNLTPLIGTCRGMFGWSDLFGNAYIACGTEQRLQVLDGGTIIDITPVVQTDNPAPAFSTVSGNSSVSVNDSVYQPSVSDWVNIQTQIAVGGLILLGYYQVTSAAGITYSFTAASNATSTVTTGGVVPEFTTTNGSAVVTVILPLHRLFAGNTFAVNVVVAVGGLTVPTGTYVVQTVINVNEFTITAPSTATSAASAFMNAGNAQIDYLLPTGYAVNTALTGYGVGDYGAGDYGVSNSDSVIGHLRQWSMDHWGQDLIACPTGGSIYYWQPPTASPALVIAATDAPTMNQSIFVIPQAQIIIALGADLGGTVEPLLVRWSDAGSFNTTGNWTASTTNQAGSYLLSSGTQIVGGTVVGLGALIWTDTDVWFMQYIGYPLIFSFTQIAGSCGLIAMRAGADTAGVVQWLSTRGFYTYQAGGGVDAIECPVWDFIFDNLDNSQLDQVHCAVNSLFNEMAWHFPIAPTSPIYNSAMPLGYVKANLVENAWDYGQSAQYQRTAWVEKNPQSYPAGTDYNGLIQQHEVSNDADGAAMVWSFQTGYFSLMEGEEFVFVDLIIPDFNLSWTGSTPPVISVSLLATDYPIGLADGAFGNPPVPLVDGPYLISTSQPNATLMVPCRLRARQIALLFQGSDLGSFARIGAVRVRYCPDGRN